MDEDHLLHSLPLFLSAEHRQLHGRPVLLHVNGRVPYVLCSLFQKLLHHKTQGFSRAVVDIGFQNPEFFLSLLFLRLQNHGPQDIGVLKVLVSRADSHLADYIVLRKPVPGTQGRGDGCSCGSYHLPLIIRQTEFQPIGSGNSGCSRYRYRHHSMLAADVAPSL